MNSSFLKKAVPHILAIILFLLVSIVYNKTALEGKVLYQSDVIGYTAMAKQSNDFKAKHGHFPLWTESMFSGMPAYNIAMDATSSITIGYFYYLFNLGLPKPIFYFFIASVCFYILTQVFRLNFLLSVLGSIAYAFATFNPILVAAGHETELMAIGYMPAVVAGVLLILRGRYLGGAAVTTLFFGMQVSTQHLQIVYYTGLILAIIAIVHLFDSWKEKKYKHWLIAFSLIALSLIVGFMNFALTMLPTKEYATETMRGGKSELTQTDSKNKTKGGLDKDYAFMWSYGIPETLTLFVPGMQGGGTSGKEITGSSKFADKLSEIGYPEDNAIRIANSRSYWGDQPFTSGPVYLGAVICFLFILGMIYVKSWHKWWILAIAVVGIMLAWGKNLSFFNYFLFDHLPYYNKFRSPAMALVMPQLAFPLLAVLGLQELLESRDQRELILKKFKKVLYITGGLVLLSFLVYIMSDYKSTTDGRFKENFANNLVQQMARGKQPTPEMQQQAGQIVNGMMSGLQEDRKGIFEADLIRSIIFVLLAAGLIWFYLSNKIKPSVLLAGLLVISSYDLMAEGKKYLNDDTYVEPENIEESFSMSDADQKIKADPEKNFRVLDETSGDPFQDSHASYYHNSVGGYHPAKLALYNDLIEHQLAKGNQQVYDMLNTKYIIRKGPDGKEDVAMLNPGAFGSCWLVSAIKYVSTADEEMAALNTVHLRDTAVVQKSYEADIPFMPIVDSTASVKLIENLNDKISYRFQAKTNQFVVFSEIYYHKGWDAYVDGKKSPYAKVDYVLRGMAVPAGSHTIEFRFEPQSYVTGNRISVWAAILTYLLLIAAVVQLVLGKREKKLTVDG
ncbi:MAG: YfhO family protein [Bacteroidota bacterium]|nr:YfhO family protein [Bacteroidota bacterium]